MAKEENWEVWDIENSSRVTKIEFREKKSTSPGILKLGDLKLTFKNSGQKYIYYNVPRFLVINAIKAESVGKALNTLIKNKNIKYEKVQE